MRNLEQQITQYAAYHRDRRNIATHFVGVPTIVFSVVLALVPWTIAGINVALIAIAVAAVYYLILDRALGTAMLIFLFVFCYLIAVYLNARVENTAAIMGVALSLFVVGWIIQFVGHKYEGMKPAFVDDIVGLAIGPLFIMTELFFALGLKRELKKYVEARVGPVLAARNGAPIGPTNSDAVQA
ncbi:MAG: Mpo1-like protein [Usitatibacteraceae bacterium]